MVKKIILIALTVLYALLYPWLSCSAVSKLYFLSSPGMSLLFKSAYVAYLFLIPVSMPITVYLIWSNYLKKRVRRALLLSTLPILLYMLTSAALKIAEMSSGT